MISKDTESSFRLKSINEEISYDHQYKELQRYPFLHKAVRTKTTRERTLQVAYQQ